MSWVRPTVEQQSPDFPGGLPLLGPAFIEIDRSGYLSKKNKDVAKRLRYPYQDMDEAFGQYQNLLGRLYPAFDGLMHDYDRKEILSATTALSLIKVSHTDLDELGNLGRNTDYEYPPDVVDATVAYYKSILKESDRSLTLPRGKNAAYPFAIPGLHRKANDMAIAAQAALAVGAKKQGWALRDLGNMLARYHGEVITIYGERRQHTGKTMPMSTSLGLRFSNNFEPRVRGIYMSPKFCVAYNRLTVKRALATFLNSQIHVQDRATISKTIQSALNAGWEVLPLDWSKYDQHMGGKRGKQVLRVVDACFADGTKYDDLLYEFEAPLVTFRQGRCYINRTAPILMSGASFTSAVGCVGNVMSVLTMLKHVTGRSPSELMASLGKSWKYLSWGDDTVLMFPKSFASRDAIIKSADVIKMKADVEPAIRYLGAIYGDGADYKNIPHGYSMGRAVQQQFFPERPKIYPFGLIGYIARLTLMGQDKAKEFHKQMKNFWDPKSLGADYFRFEDRDAILKKTVPLVNKYASRISELDDILMSLTHGLGDEGIHLDDELAKFNDLIGLTQLDLTDPNKFVAEYEGISDGLKKQFSRLISGDFNSYQLFATQLSLEFGLEWRPGDLVY